MKKRTLAAVIIGTLLLCVAAYAAGRYARETLINEAVQEIQRQSETNGNTE